MDSAWNSLAQTEITLSSTSSEPEIVVYRSYGDSVERTVRIATINTKSFICVLTYEEDFKLEVAEDARWAGGVVYSHTSTIQVDVPKLFLSESPMVVYGGKNANLLALALQPQAFRLFSNAQATQRSMPALSGFELSNESDVPHRLAIYSLPDLTLESCVEVIG